MWNMGRKIKQCNELKYLGGTYYRQGHNDEEKPKRYVQNQENLLEMAHKYYKRKKINH